MYECVINDEFV